MKARLVKLLNVKSIISMVMTLVFCYLAIVGIIGAELYVPIFTTVISFYFGTQMEKKANENNETV
jgi:5-bromo-4-chloroindolyl phosphate hydrolysis protein